MKWKVVARKCMDSQFPWKSFQIPLSDIFLSTGCFSKYSFAVMVLIFFCQGNDELTLKSKTTIRDHLWLLGNMFPTFNSWTLEIFFSQRCDSFNDSASLSSTTSVHRNIHDMKQVYVWCKKPMNFLFDKKQQSIMNFLFGWIFFF